LKFRRKFRRDAGYRRPSTALDALAKRLHAMSKRNHLRADRVVRPELPRLFTTVNMAPFSCILMVQVVLLSLSSGC
jgi:hypothetical protein